MTKLFYRSAAIWGCGVALLLSGCVDDSYDLSDIDDTMRIKVNDLTIPLRFEDGITFSDLIDDDLVDVIDDEYVILREGDFESEEIMITEITGNPNVISGSQPIPFAAVAGQSVKLPDELVKLSKFEFEFEYNQVDRYIRAITGGDVDFDITLSVSTGISCTYHELSFAMPKGMSGHVTNTGAKVTESVSDNMTTITFTDVKTTDGRFEFTYHVDRLNLPADALDPGMGDVADDGSRYGHFYLAGEISLVSCSITADRSGQGTFESALTLGSFTVNTIDGALKYLVDDFSTEANLGDLPDLLKDPNTNLSLVNPQIYLRINNPFAENNIQAFAGVEVWQDRRNESDFINGIGKQATTKSPLPITAESEQIFVLSDSKPENVYSPFAGAKWCETNGLGNIVYGKGMPDGVGFRFNNISLDSEQVSDFPIGRSVEGIQGKYTFYAPLVFGEGAKVVYTQDQSGWGIEDMVVTGLEIDADVTSTVPVAVSLKAYPIVKDECGNSEVVNDIEITSTEIGGLTKNEPVKIKMDFKGKKELTSLDGMRYTVTLNAANQSAIAPDQALELKNLRVTISGYYDVNGSDK